MLLRHRLRGFVEAEDVGDGDAVDDVARRESVDLMLEDVAEARGIVWICGFEAVALVEALDDLRDVEARLHVEIDEGLFLDCRRCRCPTVPTSIFPNDFRLVRHDDLAKRFL